MLERRRAGRVTARMLTQLAGVDTDWVMRRCNISITGVFFDIEREVGEPGSVQHLKLMTPDKLRQVDLMSRVVRVFSTNDIWRGNAVAGLAFDFMITTDELRGQLEQLLRSVYAGQEAAPMQAPPLAAAPPVEFTYAAKVPGDASALVQALNVNGMVLQTSWQAGVGETIRCEITAPTSRQKFQLEGQVINTIAEADLSGVLGYQVQVRFAGLETPQSKTPSASGLSIGDAIDSLLDEAVFQSVDTGFLIPNEHLKGLLSRIRLPSLLGFLEMERLTGTLNLKQKERAARLYLLDGRVVDCDPPTPGGDRLQALGQVLHWTEGSFEFVVGAVQRADVIQLSTTHLILKLSAEADEARR